MTKELESLKLTRLFVLKQIEDLSNEQLNKIPEGYNNNIIWHLGHLIVTHYSICYRPTGNKVPLEETFYLSYKPGSQPTADLTAAAIEDIKAKLITTVDEFQNNFSTEIFATYNTWKTPYGVEISNINDALSFVNFHEGLHIGYIMAMKKLV